MYCWDMAWEQRKCAVCDECGHTWLPAGFPKRCAKCKSILWNRGGMNVGKLGNGSVGEAAVGSDGSGDREVAEAVVGVVGGEGLPGRASGEPAETSGDIGYSSVEEVDEAPFVDDSEIEEIKPPDCPYCDHTLMLWMRPGPNKGKWACAECDKAFTVEGLRRLGR